MELAEVPSYVAMDRATAWLRGNAEDATPFLLVYSCKEPHPPFGAPDPFRAMYRPDEVALPATRSDTAGARWQELRADPFFRRQIAGLPDEELRRVYAAFWGSAT